MTGLSNMPITCYLRHFSSVGMECANSGPDGVQFPEGVQFVSGEPLTKAEAEIAESAGVAFFEIHAGGYAVKPHVMEIQPGTFDLSYIEKQASLVQSYGGSPLFSFCTRCVAPWQRTQVDSELSRCLEHRAAHPFLWSVWSKQRRDHVQKIVHEAARLMKRVNEDAAPVIIDGYGDYGEPSFPQGTIGIGEDIQEFIGSEAPHVHPGFWCGDEPARQSLKESTGLDEPPKDSSDEVAWVSFVRWYHEGMTEYMRVSAEIYRAELPKASLMVFLGSGREPCDVGQDNSGIAKAVAPYGVAIRSTSSGGMYMHNRDVAERFERNWPIIKRHATPARFYGTPFWAEPPYPPGIDPFLIPARTFEAMSCGAVALHEWVDHILQHADVYRAIAGKSAIVHPETDVAVYFPTLDHWIANDIHPEDFWRIASKLRRFVDYDVIDDRMILDGALGNYRWLVIPQATRMDTDALETLRQWARAGGIIVKRPENLQEWPGGSGALEDIDVIVASDMEDQSLITCVIDTLPEQAIVACDDRPLYATRCAEGWLILNLCRETQTVKINRRTAKIASGMFELLN